MTTRCNGLIFCSAGLLAAAAGSLLPAQSTRAQDRPDVAWFGAGTGATAIAVSPDGQRIVTSDGLFETALKMWTAGGQLVRTFAEDFSAYDTIAWSADGQYILGGREGIAGDSRATATLWHASDGTFVRGLNPGGGNDLYNVHSVAFSPNSAQAAVSYDALRGVAIYNVSTGALVLTLPNAGWMARYSPDGQYIAAGVSGGVGLFSAATGVLVRTFAGPNTLETFSSDGTRIATSTWGANNAPISVFTVADGALVRTVQPQKVQYTWDLAYSPSGLLVVAGGRDTETIGAGLTDEAIDAFAGDGTLAWSYEHTFGTCFAVRFTPDGLGMFGAGGWSAPEAGYVEGSDDSIQRFDTATGAEQLHFAGRRGIVVGAGFSPDSQHFVAAGRTIQVWRSTDGVVEHTFDEGGSSVSFSGDGSALVLAVGAPIRVWDFPQYTLRLTLPGHAPFSTSQAVISPDGSLIFSGGTDHNAKLWSGVDGHLIWSRSSGAGDVNTVAITPDGSLALAGCTASTVRIWSTATGTLVRSIFGQNAIDAICLSPDGTLVAVGEEGYGNNLKLYRVSDGSLVRAFAGTQGFEHQSVAFTPGADYLVFGSGGGELQFWRLSDFTLQRSYTKEMGTGNFPHLPVAISGDNRWLGYGRQDHTVVMARNPFGPPACYANCDASLTPPVLNVADFSCFLQRFASGDAYANCDASSQPPALNVQDFSCFLTRFAAGCR